jgi:hypothetical protein
MISAADYKIIADYIADSSASIISAKNELDAAKTALEGMVAVESKRQSLSATITTAINTLTATQTPSRNLISAVTALQKHVTKYATSVNSFLTINNITVKQAFADISAVCGYTVSPLLISG